VGYNGKDIRKKLDNYENRLSKKYYSDIGENKLKEFVENLFKQAEKPYIFESILIRDLNSDFSEDNFPLIKEELTEIVVGYFEKYCAEATNLDNNVWRLYHSCKYKEYISTGNSTYRSQVKVIEKGKQIMLDFVINKDLDGYLFAIVAPETFKQTIYAVSDTVLELFESWADFKKVIFEQDKKKWKYLDEFQKFFETFEAQGFSKYVPFNFDIIPIHEKHRKD